MRRIEPYRLVNRGRRWYLVAFDVERGDWRTFRVDRSPDDLAFWLGVLGSDFEVVDSPDLTRAVERLAGRYARATR